MKDPKTAIETLALFTDIAILSAHLLTSKDS